MGYTDREIVKEFPKENDIRDLAQLNGFIKEMTGVMIEEMLEAERNAHLGYSRYDLVHNTVNPQPIKGEGATSQFSNDMCTYIANRISSYRFTGDLVRNTVNPQPVWHGQAGRLSYWGF